MVTDEQKTRHALDLLEAQADLWAEEVFLPEMVRNIAAVPRQDLERMIDALVRQAFIEGAYRGCKDAFDEARALSNEQKGSD